MSPPTPLLVRPRADGARGSRGVRFASLYSGCGGLDLGFHRAGFQLVWANDTNREALQTHAALFDQEGIAGPLADIPWPARGIADVVVGGPPCQGFSVAGKMDADDERNVEVWRFFDFIDHVQPSAFVMENVKSLALNQRFRHVREGLVRRARDLGFEPRLVVLNAADFGVAQRRERMFLIGLRGPDVPDIIPTAERRTVRDAFRALPRYGDVGNSGSCGARVIPAKRPVLRASPYHGALLFNGSGRPLRLDVPAPTLPASMGGNSTPIVDQAELDEGREAWVVQYHRRLERGHPPADRAPQRLRRITVEEAAELQGFPQDMPWAGSTAARFRQIGNSVPPPLAYAVARTVAEGLGITALDQPWPDSTIAGPTALHHRV